jgi:hypothetical protein
MELEKSAKQVMHGKEGEGKEGGRGGARGEK